LVTPEANGRSTAWRTCGSAIMGARVDRNGALVCLSPPAYISLRQRVARTRWSMRRRSCEAMSRPGNAVLNRSQSADQQACLSAQDARNCWAAAYMSCNALTLAIFAEFGVVAASHWPFDDLMRWRGRPDAKLPQVPNRWWGCLTPASGRSRPVDRGPEDDISRLTTKS